MHRCKYFEELDVSFIRVDFNYCPEYGSSRFLCSTGTQSSNCMAACSQKNRMLK
jgi:hypothetical protein